MHEVRFTLGRDQLKDFQAAQRLKAHELYVTANRPLYRFRWFILGTLLVVGALLFPWLYSVQQGGYLVGFLPGFLLGYAVFSVYAQHYTNAVEDVLSTRHFDGKSTVTLKASDTGINTECDGFRAIYDWRVIEDVTEYHSLIVLWAEGMNGIVARSSAFASSEKKAEFLAYVRQHMAKTG